MRRLRERALADPFACYRCLFFLLPFTGGLLNTAGWCYAAALHAVFLVWTARRRGVLRAPGRGLLAPAAALLAGAVWNLFNGVDRGACVQGLLWMLALFLFGLLLCQWTPAERAALSAQLPWMGACMTVLCAVLYISPVMRPFVYENGRMAGTLQYANSFAMLLLLGLAFARRLPPGARRTALSCILSAGILASGSRIVFLLALGLALWDLRPGCRARAFWGAPGLLLAAAAVWGLSSGGQDAVTRLLGSGGATLWGRLLYAKDALRLLAAHPLGIGRLGWLWVQGMVQTGVYQVRFVHNDGLQLALDYGLPAALVAAGWLLWRLRAGVEAPEAAVLLLLHCLLDWDLQYQFLAFVLLLLLMPRESAALQRGRAVAVGAALLLAPLWLWLGTADALYGAGLPELAWQMDPWNTEYAVEHMLAQPDLARAAACAEEILRRNPCQATAWQILARAARAQGDDAAMLEAQHQAVLLLRYEQTVYDEALSMAQTALDRDAAPIQAVREMVWLLDRLDQTLAETDALAWRLPEQPALAFAPQTRLFVRILAQAAGL